jgi:hypothetical protein
MVTVDDADADCDTDVDGDVTATVAGEFALSEHANNDAVMSNAAIRRRIEHVTLLVLATARAGD